MHLLGAGLAHHLHDLHRGGAAHEAVVDQHDALARDHRAVGVVLQADAELADRLGRLDEGAADIVVADDAELERNAGGLGIADRRRHAGIGHRHDHVGRRPAPRGRARCPCLRGSDRRCGRRRRSPAGRNRCTRRCRAAAAPAGTAGAICAPSSEIDDDLAVLDVAHVARADDVERAGLRGQDRAAVELAQHQRADAERIARADQLLVGQRDERIGAFDLAQRLDEAVDEAVAAASAPPDAGSPRCRRSTA